MSTTRHLHQIQRIYDEAKAEIEIRERFGDLPSARVEDLYRQIEKAERLLSGRVKIRAQEAPKTI